MNSTIIFNTAALFNAAVTALELDATPAYELDDADLTIRMDDEDLDAIIDILHANGVYMFQVNGAMSDEEKDMHDDRDYNDDMDGDFDSGMASAGLGYDEQYEHNSFDEGN